MDWQSALLLGLGFGGLAILVQRSEPRRRRLIVLTFPLPVCYLVYRWAAYRQAWIELGIALIVALASYGIWWLALGRKLPPAQDSQIRVWTPDDPF